MRLFPTQGFGAYKSGRGTPKPSSPYSQYPQPQRKVNRKKEKRNRDAEGKSRHFKMIWFEEMSDFDNNAYAALVPKESTKGEKTK